MESEIHERYGVSLLHKHFSIEPNQRLVDYRNISMPWTVKDNNILVPKYEGFIIPRTFRFYNGILAPFEFDFSPSPASINFDSEVFPRISVLLHQHGLENVLGVRSLDGYDPELSVEITEGKTNIMIRRGSVENSKLVEALWVFSTDDDQKCHCREYCWKDYEGEHVEVHKCS